MPKSDTQANILDISMNSIKRKVFRHHREGRNRCHYIYPEGISSYPSSLKMSPKD